MASESSAAPRPWVARHEAGHIDAADLVGIIVYAIVATPQEHTGETARAVMRALVKRMGGAQEVRDAANLLREFAINADVARALVAMVDAAGD